MVLHRHLMEYLLMWSMPYSFCMLEASRFFQVSYIFVGPQHFAEVPIMALDVLIM